MIYRLKYTDKAEALTDLIAKDVLVEDSENNDVYNFGEQIEAVVELGVITLTQGTYDDNGDELTAPIFADGYHYDVMTEKVIDFGSKEIQVNNPIHKFL